MPQDILLVGRCPCVHVSQHVEQRLSLCEQSAVVCELLNGTTVVSCSISWCMRRLRDRQPEAHWYMTLCDQGPAAFGFQIDSDPPILRFRPDQIDSDPTNPIRTTPLRRFRNSKEKRCRPRPSRLVWPVPNVCAAFPAGQTTPSISAHNSGRKGGVPTA